MLALVSGSMLFWPMLKRGGGEGAVSPNEAVRLINREKGVLVDVSEPAEYAEGHAAGAKNVPVAQLEKPKELPSNKALPILLLCPTGARARRSAALLRKAGYERAMAITGGTPAWREAGLPIDKVVPKANQKAAA